MDQALALAFHNNPGVDPRSGEQILIGGKAYRGLVATFGEPKNMRAKRKSPRRVPPSKVRSEQDRIVAGEALEFIGLEPVSGDCRTALRLRAIDPFDFSKHVMDFTAFRGLFFGPELYTRLAWWILLKDAHTANGTIDSLLGELGRCPQPLVFFCRFTDPVVSQPEAIAAVLAYWFLHLWPKSRPEEIRRAIPWGLESRCHKAAELHEYVTVRQTPPS